MTDYGEGEDYDEAFFWGIPHDQRVTLNGHPFYDEDVPEPDVFESPALGREPLGPVG